MLTGKDLVLSLSALTAAAFGTLDVYHSFSRYVVGDYATATSAAMKTEFSVMLAICVLGIGFCFKKTFDSLVEVLDESF